MSASDQAAQENYERFKRAAIMAAKLTARASIYLAREAEKWTQDIEKRMASGLVSEEQAYHDQMKLDSKLLDIHMQKAEERGVLTHDQVLDIKERVEELRGAKGVTGSREASFELRGILDQFKEADRSVKLGKPPKAAYKDIGKSLDIAMNRRQQFFKSI